MSGQTSGPTSSPAPQPRRPLVDPALVALGLAVFALDQISKLAVIQGLGADAPRHSAELLGTFVRLTYTTNTGAAFGMFPRSTVVFTAVALVALPLLLFSRAFIASDSWVVRLALGLLLGGNLGNLADRLRLGHVVDFIDVGVGGVRFYAFNVADSAFVVGVVVLAVYLLLTPDLTPPDLTPDDGQRTPAVGQPGEPPGAASGEQSNRHSVV